jgi:hypothetical protein
MLIILDQGENSMQSIDSEKHLRNTAAIISTCRSGGMVDAADSKSAVGNNVGVQVPSSAPKNLSHRFFSSIVIKVLQTLNQNPKKNT